MDRTDTFRYARLAACALALTAATGCTEEPADETMVRTATGGPELGPVPPHLQLHPVHVRIVRDTQPSPVVRASEVEIRTVLFERGESTGRLLFFREDVTCSAIPTSEDDALPTLVLLVGVRTARPGWEGALDATDWRRWDPVPLSEGVEWSIELDEVGAENATGHIRAITSEVGRAFRLDDDFSAVICSPASTQS